MKQLGILCVIISIMALMSACKTPDTAKGDDQSQAKEHAVEEGEIFSKDEGGEADETVGSDKTSQNETSSSENDENTHTDTEPNKNGTADGTEQKLTEDASEQSEERDANNDPLTKKEAEALVRRHLDLDNRPEVKVQYDHEEDGRYVIHVFEIVDQGGTSHTATMGWYYVDPQTQKVESMF